MSELTLEVVRREEKGTAFAKRLRKEGKVPAVIYGGGKDPINITVGARDLSDLVNKSEHGIRSVFLLKLASSDQSRHAMVRDLQIQPLTRQMQHVDFVRVDMNVKIHVMVPIHTEGSPIGVRESDGILDQQVREIEVECLPSNIPDEIVLDVSGLDVNDSIRLSAITFPEGVELMEQHEDDPVIVGVIPKRAEEVEEEIEEIDEAAEPELISKGKDEDSEEEED